LLLKPTNLFSYLFSKTISIPNVVKKNLANSENLVFSISDLDTKITLMEKSTDF
jgi:hypothetical protein